MLDVGGELCDERELVLLNRREFVATLREGVGERLVVGIDGAVLCFENMAKVLHCFVYRQKFSVVGWQIVGAVVVVSSVELATEGVVFGVASFFEKKAKGCQVLSTR